MKEAKGKVDDRSNEGRVKTVIAIRFPLGGQSGDSKLLL